MDKLKKLKNEIRYELKENKATFIVYSILRILVIVVVVLQFRNRNFENVLGNQIIQGFNPNSLGDIFGVFGKPKKTLGDTLGG